MLPDTGSPLESPPKPRSPPNTHTPTNKLPEVALISGPSIPPLLWERVVHGLGRFGRDVGIHYRASLRSEVRIGGGSPSPLKKIISSSSSSIEGRSRVVREGCEWRKKKEYLPHTMSSSSESQQQQEHDVYVSVVKDEQLLEMIEEMMKQPTFRKTNGLDARVTGCSVCREAKKKKLPTCPPLTKGDIFGILRRHLNCCVACGGQLLVPRPRDFSTKTNTFVLHFPECDKEARCRSHLTPDTDKQVLCRACAFIYRLCEYDQGVFEHYCKILFHRLQPAEVPATHFPMIDHLPNPASYNYWKSRGVEGDDGHETEGFGKRAVKLDSRTLKVATKKYKVTCSMTMLRELWEKQRGFAIFPVSKVYKQQMADIGYQLQDALNTLEMIAQPVTLQDLHGIRCDNTNDFYVLPNSRRKPIVKKKRKSSSSSSSSNAAPSKKRKKVTIDTGGDAMDRSDEEGGKSDDDEEEEGGEEAAVEEDNDDDESKYAQVPYSLSASDDVDYLCFKIPIEPRTAQQETSLLSIAFTHGFPVAPQQEDNTTTTRLRFLLTPRILADLEAEFGYRNFILWACNALRVVKPIFRTAAEASAHLDSLIKAESDRQLFLEAGKETLELQHCAGEEAKWAKMRKASKARIDKFVRAKEPQLLEALHSHNTSFLADEYNLKCVPTTKPKTSMNALTPDLVSAVLPHLLQHYGCSIDLPEDDLKLRCASVAKDLCSSTVRGYKRTNTKRRPAVTIKPAE